MMIRRCFKKTFCVLLFGLLLLSPVLTGCGSEDEEEEFREEDDLFWDEDDFWDEEDSWDEDEEEEESGQGEMSEGASQALTGEGSVQKFIGEPFYDGVVKNEDDALEAIYSVLDFVGGDQSTDLELVATDGPTEEGNTIYTFRQVADDVAVYAATVKLVADKNGKAIGLNSTLVPGLKVKSDVSWRIDAKEAEAIVENQGKEDGENYRIIPNVTEQTLLPFMDDSSKYYYAWVVYTNNIYEDVDTAYLAHYVDEEGEYLYSIPVTQPGNSDALSGSTATFTFEGLEKDTWSGTVKKYHGETEKVTIPVAKDPKTGDVYLADLDRKVVCADYSDFINEDTLTIRKEKNGKFTDNEVLILKAFTEVYDFYESIGWVGPDGSGSPVLLLMDWVDEDGEPVQNACYSGKMQGFDTFQFNRLDPDGESYDTMAHEFTHALTQSAMTANIYMNDYGAINEAMSDIFGNLVESLMGKTKDKTWLIQENGNEVLRSMSNPNEYSQPGFVWDRYYVPAVNESTENNDQGGVHINSSLLNLIAWRLNESGMSQEDQLYYWQNVALILTPRTDLAQLADILPWTLKLVGMEQYVKVIEDAIQETGIRDNALPQKPADGLARFQMVFPDHELLDYYEVFVTAYQQDTENGYSSWPEAETDMVALTVQPGDYVLEFSLTDFETGENFFVVAAEGKWMLFNEEEEADYFKDGAPPECILTINKGEVKELDSRTLKELLEDN